MLAKYTGTYKTVYGVRMEDGDGQLDQNVFRKKSLMEKSEIIVWGKSLIVFDCF